MPNTPERARILAGLQKDPRFRIIAVTSDLMNTYNVVEDHEPKTVLIADTFAKLDEFEVMYAIFNQLDVRWLVVSGFDQTGTASNSAKWSALKSGLFELGIATPVDQIAQSLVSLSLSPRHQRATAALGTTAAGNTLNNSQRMVLIGSSTGGVDALLEVLGHFPNSCPPTLVVQHTGYGFGDSLATLLERQCTPRVVLAEDGMDIEPGKIIIGAGTGAHLRICEKDPRKVRLEPGDDISGHQPSVDALFMSATRHAKKCVAAVLTGMGRDGADGLKALRDQGALTLVQDEETSVVAGMPRSAAEAGGAQHILPLPQIGPALLEASEIPFNQTSKRQA